MQTPRILWTLYRIWRVWRLCPSLRLGQLLDSALYLRSSPLGRPFVGSEHLHELFTLRDEPLIAHLNTFARSFLPARHTHYWVLDVRLTSPYTPIYRCVCGATEEPCNR